MSRIGKLPITIPAKVEPVLQSNLLKIKGPFGELNETIPDDLRLTITTDQIIIERKNETKSAKQKHGLTRALINNMVKGVSEKFERKLQMVGVGYRAQINGNNLTLNVGYSHPVNFIIESDIDVKVENNTNIVIKGIDKHKIGLLASKIRAVRPPEPYKGKGIRYAEETVLRKAGKSGK